MSRLVVVSNRVPVPRTGIKPGGLAVVLHDLLEKTGGLWFGWSGECSTSKHAIASAAVVEHEGVRYVTVDLSPDEHRLYYNNFSNSTLWPLLHSLPEQVRFDRKSLHAYRGVNTRMADILIGQLRKGDIIWIHDYHLMPMAAALRARGVHAPVGFFLHTPFPSADILASIPEAPLFVRDLMQVDLVGFQTDHDAKNFMSCASELVGATVVSEHVLDYRGRRIEVGTFPVEIDAHAFAATARDVVDSDAARHFVTSLDGTTLLFGADRMDPTKGLRHRVQGYQRLLEERVGWREKVTLLQIAAGSRLDVEAYQFLRDDLERLSGAINAALSTPSWTPLRLVTQGEPRENIAAYMRLSRVGLVTPLRDGMNLVAKEYVAAQNPDDPGVLILSRYAGAAIQLTGALMINPFDLDQMADQIHRALLMPLSERKERWLQCWNAIEARTALSWGESFLAALKRATPDAEHIPA